MLKRRYTVTLDVDYGNIKEVAAFHGGHLAHAISDIQDAFESQHQDNHMTVGPIYWESAADIRPPCDCCLLCNTNR